MANAAGVLIGHDVSHHQDEIDVSRLAGEFIIARTLQVGGDYVQDGVHRHYSTTYDQMYATHKANARKGNKLFGSYVYLGTDETPTRNAALHAGVEPDRAIPVMVDWEYGSGNAAFLHACVDALENLGYRVNLTYAPQWYYNAMNGGVTLAGLPPLVPSKYANMTPGPVATKYAQTSESIWAGYGGNSVAVAQFSSTGTDSAYPTTQLDCLAFKGTRTQLADLFGGKTSGGSSSPGTQERELDMDSFIGTGTGADQPWQLLQIPVNGGRYLRIASSYDESVTVEGISLVGDTPGAAGRTGKTVQGATTVLADRPGPWDLSKAAADCASYSHVVVRAKADAGVKVSGWINGLA